MRQPARRLTVTVEPPAFDTYEKLRKMLSPNPLTKSKQSFVVN